MDNYENSYPFFLNNFTAIAKIKKPIFCSFLSQKCTFLNVLIAKKQHLLNFMKIKIC